MEDVEAIIPMTVGDGGRISGLTDYIGCRVLVVVPAKGLVKRVSRKGE